MPNGALSSHVVVSGDDRAVRDEVIGGPLAVLAPLRAGDEATDGRRQVTEPVR